MGILLLFVLLVLGLVSIYILWLVPKVKRFFERKIIVSGVLGEFKKIGFTADGLSMKGIYNKYFIELNLGWFDFFSEKVLRVHIAFLPLDHTRQDITNRNKSFTVKYEKKYSWFLNEMTSLIGFWIKAPNFDRISKEIEEMIVVLKNENLLPISMEESEKIQSKYEYWQDFIK